MRDPWRRVNRNLRSGRVLSAEFVNNGKTYQAMWFKEPSKVDVAPAGTGAEKPAAAGATFALGSGQKGLPIAMATSNGRSTTSHKAAATPNPSHRCLGAFARSIANIIAPPTSAIAAQANNKPWYA